MLLDSAILIADEVFAALYPHCERIEIAGSIRRKKPDVGDIELVVIPKGKMYPQKPKGGVAREPRFAPTIGFIDAVNKYQKLKGQPWDKYTQRFIKGENDNGPWGIKCDIFMVYAINWGYQFAIRTGSAEYSHKVLANGWVKKGYKGEDGYLTKKGVIVPVAEEKDLFDLIGIPYTEPCDRFLP